MPEKDVSAMDDFKAISAEDVLNFLKSSPSFLSDYPEAVDYLLPRTVKKQKKSIADFQSYLIDRLKADKEEVLDTAQVLVETARNNMNNQQRIHGAVLRLLEAPTFEEFSHVITNDLSTMLHTDVSALVIEAEGHVIPHIKTSGIRIVPEGTLNNWMANKNSLLESDIHGIEAIYGGGASLVRSQALLRVDISMNTPPAILAFGSRDPNLFIDGQATDQVTFLARVVERAFRHWLDLPR